MSKNLSRVPQLRLLVQLLFLGFITVVAIRHQTLGGGPQGEAPIDAFCPFGGLEALYRFAAGGGFIQRLFYSDLVLLVGVVLRALVVGRYFCGWICALGTLQELAHKLGRKLFGKRSFTLPAGIDKPLRYLKYVVLFGSLYLTWKTATLVIRPYDPWVAYAHLPAGLSEVWAEFSIGLVVLLLSLLGSMFYDRVFCKYLCPLGAFLGLTTKLGAFRIKRDVATCINCTLCEQKCPVNIPLMRQEVIHSAECIACLSCTTTCPTGKRGTELEGTSFLHNVVAGVQTRPLVVALLGLLLFFGVIGGARLAGYWQTMPPTLAETVSRGGELDPAGIKGFMSLQEVADTFRLDLDSLYAELKLERSRVPPATKCKDIRKLIGVSEDEFDTQNVRDAVARMRSGS